jgi:hypothetical protein
MKLLLLQVGWHLKQLLHVAWHFAYHWCKHLYNYFINCCLQKKGGHRTSKTQQHPIHHQGLLEIVVAWCKTC